MSDTRPIRRIDCDGVWPHSAQYGDLCMECGAITARLKNLERCRIDIGHYSEVSGIDFGAAAPDHIGGIIAHFEQKGDVDQRTKENLACQALMNAFNYGPVSPKIIRPPAGYVRPKPPTWLDWLKGWFKHA